MQFVAVNTKYVTPQASKYAGSVGESGSFSVKSTLKDVGITEDTEFVIVETTSNDFIFTKRGQITKKGPVTTIPPSRELIARSKERKQAPPRTEYKQEFNYEVEALITKRNTLSDLEFSLRSVYRYNNPKVHFHSQIRTLDKDDFETIKNGWIYTIRTVFGKLANALPRQNKLEFMLQCMDKFSTIDFKDTALYEGYSFLTEYIERRILQRGRLLVATDNLLVKYFQDLLPIEKVGFIHPDNGLGNTISVQAALFRDLFNLSSSEDEIKKTLTAVALSPDNIEQRFEKIFESKTWPIDLRA